MSQPVPIDVPSVAAALKEQHGIFWTETKKLRCPVTIVAFLALAALIVITSSCTTLILPGVNVVNHVILPGVLPGLCALLLSVPFLVKAYRISVAKTKIFEKDLYPLVQKIFRSSAIEDIDFTSDFEKELLDKEFTFNGLGEIADFKHLNKETANLLEKWGFNTLRKLLPIEVESLRTMDGIQACDPNYAKDLHLTGIGKQALTLLRQLKAKDVLNLGVKGLTKIQGISRDLAEGLFKAVDKEISDHEALKEKWKLPGVDNGLKGRLVKAELDTLGAVLGTNLEKQGFTAAEAQTILQAANGEWENHPELNFELTERHVAPTLIESLKKVGFVNIQNILERSLGNIELVIQSNEMMAGYTAEFAREVRTAALNHWPSQIRRLIEKKKRAVFVYAHVFTVENPRDYQDYFRTMLMRLCKEYAEDMKKNLAPKERVKLRTNAITGALENLLLPPWRRRN